MRHDLDDLTKTADGHYQSRWGEWRPGWADLHFDLREIVAERAIDLKIALAPLTYSADPKLDGIMRALTAFAPGGAEDQNLARSQGSLHATGILNPREELELIDAEKGESSGLDRLSISVGSVSGWNAIPTEDPAKWSALIGTWYHEDGRGAAEFFGDPRPQIWIGLKAPDCYLRPIWRQVQLGVGCHRVRLTARMEVFVFYPNRVMGTNRIETYAFERNCYSRAILTSCSIESVPRCPKDRPEKASEDVS